MRMLKQFIDYMHRLLGPEDYLALTNRFPSEEPEGVSYQFILKVSKDERTLSLVPINGDEAYHYTIGPGDTFNLRDFINEYPNKLKEIIIKLDKQSDRKYLAVKHPLSVGPDGYYYRFNVSHLKGLNNESN